jgi:hypothetical protein
MKKILLIAIFNILSFHVFPQPIDENILLYNELKDILKENFVSPFNEEQIDIILDSYWYGFGYKFNEFTDEIWFSEVGLFGCKMDTPVYSMTDGIIKDISYIEIFGQMAKIVIIGYNDIIINYIGIEPNGIEIGDQINKGKLIGNINMKGLTGYVLGLKIQYKNYILNPYLIYEIIQVYKYYRII